MKKYLSENAIKDRLKNLALEQKREFILIWFEISGFSVYQVRCRVKISDMRFATEQLLAALYQSRTQFLPGAELDKLKNQKFQTQISIIIFLNNFI